MLDDAQRMARGDDSRMHGADKVAETAVVGDGASLPLTPTGAAEGPVEGRIFRGEVKVDTGSMGDSGRRGKDRALDTAVLRGVGSDVSKDATGGNAKDNSHASVSHGAVPRGARCNAKDRADKSEGAHVGNGDQLLELSLPATPLRREAQNASNIRLPMVAKLQHVGFACTSTGLEHRGSRGLERALKLATRCLEVDGSHADAYMLRAEIELRLGRKDRSVVDFEAAALLSVGDPRLRVNQVMEHPFVENGEFPT